ncbi:MAG: thermonuclease family protein [Gammaproteobacteria bacterium]|nr:thermonuclease family protein [Gammaproteobacteria bacterium]
MKYRLLFLLFITSTSLADDRIYADKVIVSEVVSIYDADTFRVHIKHWPDIIGKRAPVRVNGVDAPEIRGKCQKEKDLARQAKQFTVQALRGAKVIELRNIKRGKYFRLLADVYVDNKNLTSLLIGKGFARQYSGGRRDGWCH